MSTQNNTLLDNECFLWICLLLIYPLGLFLLWFNTDCDRKSKKRLSIIFGVIFLFGCSLCMNHYSRSYDPNPPTAALSTTTETDIKDSPIICTTPGLGDTVENFAQKHKLFKDNGTVKIFDNEHFVIVSSTDRIINISIQRLDGYKQDPTISEMIPKDSKIDSVKTGITDDMNIRDITIRKSDTLKKTVPNSHGILTQIDVFDKKTSNYLYTVLATGPYKE